MCVFYYIVRQGYIGTGQHPYIGDSGSRLSIKVFISAQLILDSINLMRRRRVNHIGEVLRRMTLG